MENNFGQILLNLVSTNKDKFLGLLRRNGVLVNTNISNLGLTNMILKAMRKSETFKNEAFLLMSVLMSENNPYLNFANMGGYSNVTGTSFNPTNPFSALPTFDPNAFASSESTSSTTAKKDFEDTTVGTILDKLFTLGNTYLTKEELAVRKAEAQAGQNISNNEVRILELGDDKKDDEKSNTGLYVGLAIGGVAVVGLLVYLIAKKK